MPPCLAPPAVCVDEVFGRFGHFQALWAPSQKYHSERTTALSSSLDVVPLLPALFTPPFVRPPPPHLALPLPLPLPFSPFQFSLVSRLTIQYCRHVAALCPAGEQSTHLSAELWLWLDPRATVSAFARAVDFLASKWPYYFMATRSMHSRSGQSDKLSSN